MESTLLITLLMFALPLALVAWMLRKMLPGKAKIRVPMSGTFHVTGTSERAHNAVYQTATLAGVLTGEGIEARPMTLTVMVKCEKLPHAGAAVPVVYCSQDPTQVKFLWDQVPSGSDQAQVLAQQLAEEMNRRSRP